MGNPETNINQIAIRAAQVQGKPLFCVRHIDGTLLELTPSEQVARSCVKGNVRGTHLVEISKLSPLGHLTRIHKPQEGGFLLADLCKVVYREAGARRC